MLSEDLALIFAVHSTCCAGLGCLVGWSEGAKLENVLELQWNYYTA